MKPVSIHPFSALAGAALLGLVLLATGAVQTAVPIVKLTRPFPGTIQVEGIPTPQQMMRVAEGQPFTVPTGKLFVVTGLGMAQVVAGYGAHLRFDGQPVVSFYWSGEVATFVPIPPGFVATAGTVVSADSASGSGTNAVATGYLVDA